MIPNFDVENPFNITKATDFSNQEIAEYWVDFYTANGEDLGHYLNPNDLTPKYIIGSKGCGKTHLLRYFSFPLQKLRHNNDTSKLIKEDKYIGLNIDFGAITSTRMSGCNINDNQWNSIFGYYLELFSGIYLLDTLSILIRDLKITEEEEKRIVAVIKRTICYEHKLEVGSNVKEFRTYINDLKKNADYHINNAALIRSIDFDKLEIKFSPGDIFFKIPAILISEISQFKDLKFIFILDELERLRDYQKIYVNTLVWDKKRPTTFWIGARTFGFTTRQINNGEVLRNGSEYQEIRLDEIMREDEERYKTFATNLCAKRLSKLMTLDLKEEKEILRSDIDKYFDHFDEIKFLGRLRKNFKKEFPHEKHFKSKLKEGIEKKMIKGILTVSEINTFYHDIIKDDDLLFEKYKIYFFFRQWVRTNNFSEISSLLKDEILAFKNARESSKIKGYQEKYKMDFLAQLIFENNIKLYTYTGLVNFMKVSSGNARAFLVILKEIFERAKLNQENPFQQGSKIKVKTQSIGIYQASKWFYEDTEAYGEDGRLLYRCIYNLTALLQGIRFSDKPSETTPSSFSFKPEKISSNAEKFINLAVIHRILIPVSPRHDKNSDRIEISYQINKMLAPYFNLPISRRGIVPLNELLIEAIFNPSKHLEFQTLFNDYIGRMNAPFGQIVPNEMF